MRLWSAERAVSAALIPVSILPFVYTTPATDALFCTLAVLHSHWGIEVGPFRDTTPATDALFCTLAVLHSHWGIEVGPFRVHHARH